MADVRPSLPDYDRSRIAVYFSVTNDALFALMSLAQWAGWGGLTVAVTSSQTTLEVVGEGLAVTGVNLVYGLVVIAGTFALHPMRRPWRARLLIVTAVALAASVPRVLALQAIHSTPASGVYLLVEFVAGLVAGVVAVSAGMLAAALIDRARTEETRRAQEERRARRAVDELQAEEMRVRRMVSDQLHGNLQYRMVVVTAGLDRMAEQLDDAGDEARAEDLRGWAETLEEIREDEVRSLSHAVFPSGAELSTATAIEVLLRRLPPDINASIELGPTYRGLIEREAAPMPIAERLVAIYTVEEAVTNALKHGRARTVLVRAEASPTADPARWVFEVTVDDDGVGPPSPPPELHGLDRHRSRIVNRGGTLELTRSPQGGARLHFTLPFERTGGDVAVPQGG